MIINKRITSDYSRDKLELVTGVVIHDTDNLRRGTGAKWHADYLFTDYAKNRQASWHYSVDDKSIWQSVPENIVAWHAGRVANYSTIGIEICVNADSDLFLATENTAELTADILIRHNLPATGHVFRHQDFMAKDCPKQLNAGRPYPWERFLRRVEDYYNSKMKLEEIKNIARGL